MSSYLLDELQVARPDELTPLIVGLHYIEQLRLPLAFAGAGLPHTASIISKAESYGERLFEYLPIGRLETIDGELAVAAPAARLGVTFEPNALYKLLKDADGYPFFIQHYAKWAWNYASGSPITSSDFVAVKSRALARLDSGFFKARFDRTTDAERWYLRAMAAISDYGPYSTTAVAARLKKSTRKLSAVRKSLIAKGLIYGPRFGYVDFTVPLFQRFMLRQLPEPGYESRVKRLRNVDDLYADEPKQARPARDD